MKQTKDSIQFPRIICYGAGAIGGQVGGRLVRAGYSVVLIDRPDHVEAIKKKGLRLDTPGGVYTIQVPAVTSPNQIEFKKDDVVLLCVKSQITEEAMRLLKKLVDDVPIFSFQNGVRNEEIIANYFPRVYGAELRIGGVCMNPGEVVVRSEPPGAIIIGRYPQGTDDLIEALAIQLRAAYIKVLVTPDVMPYKWGKLMYNLGNAINGITGIREADTMPIIEALRKEATSIVSQADIKVITVEELGRLWPEGTQKPRIRRETSALSSTWQSLSRQEGNVETEYLNGEIVRIARRTGKQAPLNETINRITQEMATKRELPGKYSPVQLAGLLGINLK